MESIGLGFVPPTGPPSARLVLIGESAGYEEAIVGEPFYGSAGGVLSRLLHRAGIHRADVRIANTVACRPPNDYLVGAPWEEHALSQCRQYFDPVLAAVPDDAVVVPLGGTALQAVLHLRGVAGIQIREFHGTVSRDPTDRFWVVPTFHPSFLQRGAMNLLQIVTEDLRLADRISQHGFTRSPSQLVVDPTPEWFAGWVADHLRAVVADVDCVHLSLDTEFAEKSGKDESEVTAWNAVSPITRVNGASDGTLGWTVPYVGPYIAITETLLAGLAACKAWIWLWNKYADWDHLQQAGHTLDGIMAIDGMWLWHYLQSDVFRGLGFVAPMASDFGAWKHWSEDKSKEGAYAAADGVQNWRTCMWCLRGAMAAGLWDVFLRDWHDRDEYCLRPAHVQGVPIDRVALAAFHAENQRKLGSVLERIKETAARGVLRPKAGYRKAPSKKCATCKGKGVILVGTGHENICDDCEGAKVIYSTTPPASILGKPKKGGGEAKTQYMLEGVTLVEVEIEIDIRVCETCHAEDVGPRHRCPQPPKPKAVKRRRRPRTLDGSATGDLPAVTGSPGAATVPAGAPGDRPVPRLVAATRRRARYFWQLPFNPDAPAQIIQYLADKGIEAPVDKKTRRATTNKKALDVLKAQHRDDPFFQLQLDWKAVQKVDATYAVGTAALLDADDRVHPEYLPIPSTLRDSARHPNLTNVVADKSGPQSLAAGFRRCVVARDGVPAGVTNDDLAAWEARWLR